MAAVAAPADRRVSIVFETLSDLDTRLRAWMRAEIARPRRDLGATMVYGTRDQIEAIMVADRLFDESGAAP